MSVADRVLLDFVYPSAILISEQIEKEVYFHGYSQRNFCAVYHSLSSHILIFPLL